MDIAATAAVIMTLFKKEKIMTLFKKEKQEEEKDDNKLTSSFFKNDNNTIIVGKPIENWEDNYICEEFYNYDGCYGYKYTKKK